MEEKILCYHGRTLSGKIESDEDSIYNSYLYEPKSNTVILSCPKGTSIISHRVTSGKEEYLQGGKVFVDKDKFSRLVDRCEELNEIKDSCFELFSECLENRVKGKL